MKYSSISCLPVFSHTSIGESHDIRISAHQYESISSLTIFSIFLKTLSPSVV
ncbi:MAG: hypothetical protein Q8S84_05020 [bacterium]|nr:hypothetical protein [bacterium]